MNEQRHPDPPPGPRLVFADWTRRIVSDVRRRFPDSFTVKAPDRTTVVLRYRHRTATITDDGATRVVTFGDDDRRERTSPTSVADPDRGDAFTAAKMAQSIATFLR